MAEIIGLIASIGTLVAAGFKVAKVANDITERFDTAGANIKAIAADTKALAMILQSLKNRLKAQKIPAQAQMVIYELVAVCKTDIQHIELLLAPFLQSHELRTAQKMRWMLARSKVTLRHASLNSAKLTLNMLICSLDCIDGDLEYIEEEVKVMVLEAQNMGTTMLEAERADRDAERVEESLRSSGLSSPTGQLGIENSIGTSGSTGSELSGQDSIHDDRPEEENINQNSQLLLYGKGGKAELTQITDQNFMLIAAHVHLKDMAAEFALAVMLKSTASKDGAPSEHEWREDQSWSEHPRTGFATDDPVRSDRSERSHSPAAAAAEPSAHTPEIERLKIELQQIRSELEKYHTPPTTPSQPGPDHSEIVKLRAELQEYRNELNQRRGSPTPAPSQQRGPPFTSEAERLRAELMEYRDELQRYRYKERLEAEQKAEAVRRKNEAELLARAEAAARAKLEAAIMAEQRAKEMAQRKAFEEQEWRKALEEEASLKAEIQARKRIEEEKERERASGAAEAAFRAEMEAFKREAREEAKAEAAMMYSATQGKKSSLQKYLPQLRKGSKREAKD
ncbi:hypothetical protein ANO14919_079660 [Xylariales sp. No.14919]|nr:hypothetical protein ANO14919_079660 [Xylariales sp. No.14919]